LKIVLNTEAQQQEQKMQEKIEEKQKKEISD